MRTAIAAADEPPMDDRTAEMLAAVVADLDRIESEYQWQRSVTIRMARSMLPKGTKIPGVDQ